MLPIVADQAIINLNNTLFAKQLVKYHQKMKNHPLAIMYLLLSEINGKNINYFNKFIDEYLKENDMLSLYNSLKTSIDLKIDIRGKCPDIYKKYTFSCITMLLSCGEYKKAEELFKEFVFNASYFLNFKTPISDEQFHFYFLWADTKHLLNCYSTAINILDELIICQDNQKNHLCQLYWMKAHCLRHQWKDFYESLRYYQLCYDLSREIDEKEYIIRSLHGMICISYIISDNSFDFNAKFNELDEIYRETESKWDIYKYNTLKYKSIYERIMTCDKVNAEELLQRSLKGYQKLKRRNVYDVYFEFGELYRAFGDESRAIMYYDKCYQFAKNNFDFNLQSLAQMGRILVHITTKQSFDKNKFLEELQSISLTCEEKELYLNRKYAKFITEQLSNNDRPISNIMLFNP